MPTLFDPFRLKGVIVRNRIAASPMCQYVAQDGVVSDWHGPHYAGLARGAQASSSSRRPAFRPKGGSRPATSGSGPTFRRTPFVRLSGPSRRRARSPAFRSRMQVARRAPIGLGRATTTFRMAIRAAGPRSRPPRSHLVAISRKSLQPWPRLTFCASNKSSSPRPNARATSDSSGSCCTLPTVISPRASSIPARTSATTNTAGAREPRALLGRYARGGAQGMARRSSSGGPLRRCRVRCARRGDPGRLDRPSRAP
jgi:hypothetical protein